MSQKLVKKLLIFNFCHKIKFFDIPKESELKIIEEYAFDKSSIESITILASLVEIKK